MPRLRAVAILLSGLLCLMSGVVALDSEHEIKLAILLTRHGDRTPTKLYPNCKSEWKEGLGQLTALGLKQMFDLGTKLRERYIDTFKLISPSFHTDEVFVRSTSKDRTLMSAHAFMQGLYPVGTGPMLSSKVSALPAGAQAVPIHASDTHNDPLLYAYNSCPRLKLLKKVVHSSPMWTKLEEEHKGLVKNMSDLFGAQMRLKDLSNIAVLLQQEKAHNQPSLHIPPHTIAQLNNVTEFLFGHKFPTREMVRQPLLPGPWLTVFCHRVGWRVAIYSQMYVPSLVEAALLLASVLNLFIIRRMEKVAYPERFERKKKVELEDPMDIHKREKKDPKFVYYSGHDGTILALFSALGAHDLLTPKFASSVILELHRTKAGEYLVEMEYDGQDVIIPGCDAECPLDDFISLSEDGIADDWTAECNNLHVDALPKDSKPKEHHDHHASHSAPHTFYAIIAPLFHTPLLLLLITYFAGLATGLLFIHAKGRGPKIPPADKNKQS